MTNLHILMSWMLPHMPRKKFTANRAQFLGMITKQYLDQINPEKKTGEICIKQCCLNKNHIAESTVFVSKVC